MPQQVIWQPQEGPQTELIRCPVTEVFYGGARGGGKTEASIGDWLEHSGTYGASAVGVFFRRKFKQLEEVVARTQALFPQIGAKYNSQRAEWLMPGGARLKFRYIERDIDAQEYQGHNYTRIYIEEATNFPTAAPINLLRGTLRSAAGVPVGLRLTGNPGGPGHHWVKARYITPDPRGWKILVEEFDGVQGEKLRVERVFIPSKISDNALLYKNDPYYVARLRQAGSEALVKAWLTGNWDLVDGAFFDTWDEERHVLRTRDWLPKIPRYALRFRAYDHGFAKPFSCGWYAVSDGTWGLPDGALLKYREWYGSSGSANVGMRMNADLVAKGILARETILNGETGQYEREAIAFGVADPSIYKREGGPCIAEIMAVEGLTWRKADNQRIPGWSEVRRRLGPVGSPPLIYFLDCCDDTVRTLPVAQHDDTNPEDLDTEQEDHALDELRYACMGRPWIEYKPDEETLYLPKLPSQMTIMELVEQNTMRRRLAEADSDWR